MKLRKTLVLAFALIILGAGCGDTVIEDDYQPPPDRIPGSNPYQSVTVTGSVVNLRQGPGTQYAVVGRAVSGETLLVTGEAPDWYRVYVPEKSLFAWIYAELTTGADLPD